MALEAKLKIEGKSYTVLESSYEFNQPIDSNGKPSAYPRGGLINITIQAPDNKDSLFHEWMFSKSEVKEGEIDFTVTKELNHNSKLLKFEYAHCIHLNEYFNNTNTIQMYMKIIISAAIIKFGSVTYTNNELLV